MDKFSRKQNRADAKAGIPKPPETCNRDGCQNPTTIKFIQVSRADEIHIGIFGDLGSKHKSSDGSHDLVLRGGYQFERWITRCSLCYIRELYRSGKGAINSIARYAASERKKQVEEFAEFMRR